MDRHRLTPSWADAIAGSQDRLHKSHRQRFVCWSVISGLSGRAAHCACGTPAGKGPQRPMIVVQVHTGETAGVLADLDDHRDGDGPTEEEFGFGVWGCGRAEGRQQLPSPIKGTRTTTISTRQRKTPCLLGLCPCLDTNPSSRWLSYACKSFGQTVRELKGKINPFRPWLARWLAGRWRGNSNTHIPGLSEGRFWGQSLTPLTFPPPPSFLQFGTS